ncbi:hypothetical protein HPSA50_1371 [Helicobacter pylori SouthAfrica50]|uniref:Uncharacterized protein n=1 Tax=Helicobacter pylori SouthAfrica50 TaxID=1352357 RepID=T2S9T8_HELPX|nr:hypothetical protein HPSA50_1371 [Helicobacter pylori SouthAfrica50]
MLNSRRSLSCKFKPLVKAIIKLNKFFECQYLIGAKPFKILKRLI